MFLTRKICILLLVKVLLNSPICHQTNIILGWQETPESNSNPGRAEVPSGGIQECSHLCQDVLWHPLLFCPIACPDHGKCHSSSLWYKLMFSLHENLHVSTDTVYKGKTSVYIQNKKFAHPSSIIQKQLTLFVFTPYRESRASSFIK